MRGRTSRLVVALALAAAVAVAAVGPAAAGLAPGQRGITVVGTGTATVSPDSAQWSFGVTTTASTARVALRQNNRAIRKVLAALAKAGVAAGDLRTEQVSIYPQSGPDGSTIAYQATNSVTATIRKLGQAGKIVAIATEAGANNVYGPTFAASSTSEAYKQALDAALADARDKAQFLAERTGVALGQVVEVTEGTTAGYVPASGSDQAAEPAPSVVPGLQKIQATLTVVFAVS